MIKSFRSKALERYWTRGDSSKIRPDWVRKVQRFLNAISVASEPGDMDLPGSGFHALTGDMAGRYALTISRNYRLTFAWDDEGAADIDLGDYHG